MSSDFCDFKFLQRSVGGKLLLRFQSENAVFKLFTRSVDGALTRYTYMSTSLFLFHFFPSARYRWKSAASETQQTKRSTLVLFPNNLRLLHIMAQEILAATLRHKLLGR